MVDPLTLYLAGNSESLGCKNMQFATKTNN